MASYPIPQHDVAPVPVIGRGAAQMPYAVCFDEPARLIRAEAHGVWSMDQAHAYIAALTSAMKSCRDCCGAVRLLIDRREVTDQSDEVKRLLADVNRSMFRAEDRVALVVGSSLAKAGLRIRMAHEGTKAFLSIDAAEMWLTSAPMPGSVTPSWPRPF